MVYDIKYSDFIVSKSKRHIILDDKNKSLTSSTSIRIDLSIFNDRDDSTPFYITIKPPLYSTKCIYFTGKSDKQGFIELHTSVFGFIEDMTNVTLVYPSATLYKSHSGMYIPVNRSMTSLILGNYIILDDDCFFIDRTNKRIECINVSECPHIHILNQLVGYML